MLDFSKIHFYPKSSDLSTLPNWNFVYHLSTGCLPNLQSGRQTLITLQHDKRQKSLRHNMFSHYTAFYNFQKMAFALWGSGVRISSGPPDSSQANFRQRYNSLSGGSPWYTRSNSRNSPSRDLTWEGLFLCLLT